MLFSYSQNIPYKKFPINVPVILNALPLFSRAWGQRLASNELRVQVDNSKKYYDTDAAISINRTVTYFPYTFPFTFE